jgi:hypothetical protein
MKYYKTIDLYWHIKALLGKVITDRNIATNEVMLQLEYLQLQTKVVDEKVSLLAEWTVGLNLNEPNDEIPQVRWTMSTLLQLNVFMLCFLVYFAYHTGTSPIAQHQLDYQFDVDRLYSFCYPPDRDWLFFDKDKILRLKQQLFFCWSGFQSGRPSS